MTPAERVRAWQKDPVFFVRDCLQVEPDLWQIDVLTAFNTHQRIAMKACKGPGKTCLLAWLIWYFLSTRADPKIACTSISGDNLSDCLWTELAFWRQKSRFLQEAFEWQKTRIEAKESPATWWASARQWSRGADRTRQADTLAGLHAASLLFVVDEAGGVPDAVMAAAEAGLSSGGDTHLLIAGNPVALEGPLYRATTSERHLWHLTEITGDPDDPKRSPRVSVEWAKQQIEKYGKDNPWVQINVFGKFPPAGLNTLLGPDDVTKAMATKYEPQSVGHQPRILGVDVARFGDDRTVIFPRQGLIAGTPHILRNANTQDITGAVGREYIRWEADAVMIDGTGGWGAGVIDVLREGGYTVIEVNASGKPNDPRFFNKRAECYFEMAEWVKHGGSLFPDPELTRELTAPTYLFHNGKMQIEAKDQIKQRLGYSPDLSDALSLTWAQPILGRRRDGMDDTILGVLGTRAATALKDYNPLSALRR